MPMCETSITLWYTQTMEYYIIIKNNEGTYSWQERKIYVHTKSCMQKFVALFIITNSENHLDVLWWLNG